MADELREALVEVGIVRDVGGRVDPFVEEGFDERGGTPGLLSLLLLLLSSSFSQVHL